MDEDTQPTERNHSALLTTLVLTSIVALGVVAAGLTAPTEEPELTSLPTTSVTPVPELQQPEYVVVTPEVDASASIPGCDTVEPPSESSYFGIATMGDESYDNPAAPGTTDPELTSCPRR